MSKWLKNKKFANSDVSMTVFIEILEGLFEFVE